jgi:hypothetical protein
MNLYEKTNITIISVTILNVPEVKFVNTVLFEIM